MVPDRVGVIADVSANQAPSVYDSYLDVGFKYIYIDVT
jgi:hypothetical protein